MNEMVHNFPEESPPHSPSTGNDDDLIDNNMNEDDVVEEADIEIDDDDVEDENNETGAETISDADFVFRSHAGSVFCSHIDPSLSKLVATGGEDDTAYVWNSETGDIFLKCEGHKDSVTSVEFSSDGCYLATGDMLGCIQVWKLSSKSVIWDFNMGDMMWMKWHHGTNVLFGGCDSGDIYVWRIPRGDCKVLHGNGQSCEVGVVLPDGKRLAAGYSSGSVKIYDLKNACVKYSLENIHEGSVSCLAANRDNNLIISGGFDGKASLVKSLTGKVVSTFDCRESEAEHENSIEDVGFNKETTLPLASIGKLNGDLSIWDVSRGTQRHKHHFSKGITKLIWHPTDPLVITGHLDGAINMYDARSGEIEKEFHGHSENILSLAISKDGKYIISSSDDQTARIFKIEISYNYATLMAVDFAKS